MTIANLLTLFRIFVGPLFLFIYTKFSLIGLSQTNYPFALLGLLIISELSDAFDGHLARKMHQVTDLGKILDPMADSIYRTSIFLTFTLDPIKLPMILVFIFIYRDTIIGTLRTICALKGFTLSARTSGKLKAVIQATVLILITILMIPYSMGTMSLENLRNTSIYLTAATALYTLCSGIEYLIVHRDYIKKVS